MTASCRCASSAVEDLERSSRCARCRRRSAGRPLADHRRHVGVGHGRGPCLGAVDQALLQAVERFFPGDRHRVEVERFMAMRPSCVPVTRFLVPNSSSIAGDGRLVGPGQTHLDAAQFGVAEQELQAVALLERLAQDALDSWAVEEIVLVRAARGTCRRSPARSDRARRRRSSGSRRRRCRRCPAGPSRRRSWPQIWLLPMNSMRISPSVRSSRSRENSRHAGALDQQVLRVEAGSAEFQRVLGLLAQSAFRRSTPPLSRARPALTTPPMRTAASSTTTGRTARKA
jgi:hypothetical protein